MDKGKSITGTLAIAGGCFLVMILIAIWVDDSRPNSTTGVENLGDNVALVPAGGTVIFTDKVGKSTQTWRVTYDGYTTVTFNCTSMCGDHIVHLCGVDCTVDTKSGFIDHIYTTQRADDTVTIRWPWGWHYRPPKP